MRKFLIYLFFSALIPSVVSAQKVGLVLSGGGARGLAHIGVIKALEDNNIPIDYISGTSMGAIVGALYSMGYTPDEMIEKIKSDDFQRWYTGTMDQNYMFYFKKNRDVPDLASLHFDIKDSLRIVKPSINLVNATPMNLGFMEIFARENVVCNGNFDSLMVPFRCVAADVYHKKEIIFSNGDLGDAVRASMSYPFFFKPIRKDSILLYDGGLFNNFPADIMEREFNPDIIIGSVVTNKPSPPDERDIMSQVINLVVDRNNYTIPEGKGITLNMYIKGVNLLDFHKADFLTTNGYNITTEYMDSIKKIVHRREEAATLTAKRKEFKERIPEFVFNDVVVHGVTKEQEMSIKRIFLHNKKQFNYDDCKKGYYSLLSGDIIESIVPHALYNSKDSAYTLHLDVTVNPPFTLKLGAGISSSISNQIYFGIHYRNLSRYSKEFIFDGQLGKVYNNLQLSGRFDLFQSNLPVSLKFTGSYSTIDYYNMKYLFSKENSVALNHQREVFAKVKLILPFLTKKKAEIGIGIADIKDEYMPSNILNLDNPKFDCNDMTLFGGTIKFEGNTLNAKVFPTSGTYESIVSQFIIGKEKYRGIVDVENQTQRQSWLQISYTRRDHFKISQGLTVGTLLQMLYSTRRLSKTYQATMMQAGSFTPTMNSLFNYDPKFRANQYIAGGITPIIKLNSFMHLRPSFYAFVPYRMIKENSDGTAGYSRKRFNDFQYIGEIGLVGHFSNISACLFANYHSSRKNNVHFGITLGWFMFNERFIE